jgi:non-ribosomal peptide synthetase component F
MTDRHSVEPIAKLERGAVHAPNLNESLVAAFERVVSRFPSRIALGSSVWEPTYQELNETANRLAHRLIGYGNNSGDRVAILMSHDAPMVAAVIGILKARQIVVALNPDDPVARLKMLVEDTQPSVVVTDVKNRGLVAEFTPPTAAPWILSQKSRAGRSIIHRLKLDPRKRRF